MNNIYIFTHDYSFSGANMSLVDYLSCYDKNNNNVTVIIPRKKTDFYDALTSMGINVIISKYIALNKNLNSLSFKEKIKKILKHIYNIVFYLGSKKKLKKSIKNSSVNLIITNSFSCLLGAEIAFELGIRHTFHIREFMELDHKITHYNQRKVEKLCLFSKAIFISNSIKEYYDNKYKFNDSIVLYNKINKLGFKKERELFSDGINLLIAGIIQENKGQFDVIRAVEILNSKYKVKLYICGEGPQRIFLTNYCKHNNLDNVVFTGLISYSDLLNIRKNIDISIVASKHEALGRVTVESMYYESFTIGVAGGETKYLLDDEKGFLYNFGDYKELARLVEQAYLDVEKTKRIIEKAKQYAESKFSDIISEKIISFSLN